VRRRGQDCRDDSSVAPFLLRPIVYRDDELQSRPHLGHGADFDIDEPGIEPALTNHVPVMSVTTPELFFGQEIHSIPAETAPSPQDEVQVLIPRATWQRKNEIEIFILVLAGDALDLAFRKRIAKRGLHVVRHVQQGNAETVLDA